MNNWVSREYVINVVITLVIAVIIWIPFYNYFGNSDQIFLALPVIGMPHFILGALGYFSYKPSDILPQFLFLAFIGLGFGFAYHSVFSFEIALFLFVSYFLLHAFSNELMFESSIKTGYKSWDTSWPTFVSWRLIFFIFTIWVVADYFFIQRIQNLPINIGALLLVATSVVVLILGYTKAKKTKIELPYGFILVFGVIFTLGLIFFGLFWNGHPAPLIILVAIYHFIAWYVFYVKKLIKRGYKKKNNESNQLVKIIFYWQRGWKQFLITIFVLQSIWAGFLLIYLQTPYGGVIEGVIGIKAAIYWTLIHITTSFLPKHGVKINYYYARFKSDFELIGRDFKDLLSSL